MSHKLRNNLRLWILRNWERSRKSQNCRQLFHSFQPSSQSKNFVDTSKKLLQNRNQKLYRISLFHMKTRVCEWLQLYRSCHNPYRMFCYVYYWLTIYILQILHILINLRRFSFLRQIPFHVLQSWMDKHKNRLIRVPFIFLPQQVILRICAKTKIVKIVWK